MNRYDRIACETLPQDEPIHSKAQSRCRLNIAIAPHLCIDRDWTAEIAEMDPAGKSEADNTICRQCDAGAPESGDNRAFRDERARNASIVSLR